MISFTETQCIYLIYLFNSKVCEEAKCPNIGECWGGGEHGTATATIMVSSLQEPEHFELWRFDFEN